MVVYGIAVIDSVAVVGGCLLEFKRKNLSRATVVKSPRPRYCLTGLPDYMSYLRRPTISFKVKYRRSMVKHIYVNATTIEE